MTIQCEQDLIRLCLGLIGNQDMLTPQERQVGTGEQVSTPVFRRRLASLRQQIMRGKDPLGEAFSKVRSAQDRRGSGAIYTPLPIVNSMLRWLSQQDAPARIIDPGAGSGRFIALAGEHFPNAQLVAVEMDPVAALMLRANLAVRGLTQRTTVIVDDYRNIDLAAIEGRTAFVGNPPYVRHHDIGETWKRWYSSQFGTFGIKASALAGLHLHFFLKTRLLARAGDLGVFITSAEWMDVNYGSALRQLLLQELGGLALHVLEPTVEAFPGTSTTAAITCFRVGATPTQVRTRSVERLSRMNCLSGGIDIPRARFVEEPKWSAIVRPDGRYQQEAMPLGELFRVHRGQVTGANNVWIAGQQAEELPDQVLFPSVTKAKDLFIAGDRLTAPDQLRRVVDIPPDLDVFTQEEREKIEAFLEWAKQEGADQTYVAQHRRAWWSVGLKAPAAILCTYMARRPPHFSLNVSGVRHINVAHGLYPLENLNLDILARIVSWLNQNVSVARGRTYAGGLTKFEPKEIERLRIPSLETFIQ